LLQDPIQPQAGTAVESACRAANAEQSSTGTDKRPRPRKVFVKND
jgi:hypothetical protein